MDDIKINDIIEVTVTGIQKYGAFVLINNKYDGLIHISEISSGYVKNINDYIRIKDKIYAQVVDKDEETGKFKLSIKNIDYRNDGRVIGTEGTYTNGFEPLKEHLDLWINEKIKEMKEPEVINAVIGPRVDNVFDKEYIIAAANHYSNGDGKILPFHSCYGIKEGFVVAGFRHPLVIQAAKAWKEKGYECVEEGFITSYGRFVDRKEDFEI